MRKLTLGSLFDGIGGFPLSAERNGIETKWTCEVDKNCSKLTKEKFPNVLQYGDIRGVNGLEIEPVDIISFGSPCNNLSNTGNLQGLEGKDSSLFFEAIRIVREMREKTNGKKPRYIIWENVTGALSCNKGQDFRRVLEEITESRISIPKSSRWARAGLVRGEGYSVAWRVFNSEYWGVPQSRERIFLVADFRGQSAAEILFEQESSRGDTEENSCAETKAKFNNAESIGKVRTTGAGTQVTTTIFASYGTKWNGNNGAYSGKHFVIEEDGRLRRLTPLETERLMGFPDNWTAGYKDTIRYRMTGNSIVIPIVEWLFKSILVRY